MSFNPFEEKPMSFDKVFRDWKDLYPKAYNKNEVDPYTKCRVILMNGTEFEQVWCGHQGQRMCNNNDIRREMAVIRRSEQQQQKSISYLKPIDENVLEHTIGYEQLAVDLTAFLAKNEPNEYVKQALDFALLEDFDHLYRYSDLLEMDTGVKAERLVGKYTEIMPGRPTIAHHRYPSEAVKRFVDFNTAEMSTKLNTQIITAAEQQTMNYYMNIGPTYMNDLGREVFMEIGMVEEQHVTQYGSLIDPNVTELENLLMHEFTECYLYYSCYNFETDKNIKMLWELHLMQEIAHLHMAKEMLMRYEKKEWQQVIPCGEFPKLLELGSNIDYVRNVLDKTVNITANGEDYARLIDIPDDSNFFKYQAAVNGKEKEEPVHKMMNKYIDKNGKDYRFEIDKNPIEDLRDRTKDNTDIGRNKSCKGHNELHAGICDKCSK